MQTVGDIFLTFVEFFRAPYKQFIMRFSEVSQAIDICAKRSGVDAFFTVFIHYFNIQGLIIEIEMQEKARMWK